MMIHPTELQVNDVLVTDAPHADRVIKCVARNAQDGAVMATAKSGKEYRYLPVGDLEIQRSRYNVFVAGCPSCDARKDGTDPHGPAHEASDRCESHRRPHCSCDRCY
jgi:hypothetical protein